MTFKNVMVLGTGGTIAGRASNGSDNVGYRAGEVGIADLLCAVPGMEGRLAGCQLRSEQVAQVDSKDMDWGVWFALLRSCELALRDASVAAVVITHGTDTLEETAYFLHLALPPDLQKKPVVLTCAMRPASALTPDGPQNILDAVSVALDSRSWGVTAVCGGAIHAARHVQKSHTYRVDAFDSGDAGPLGWIEEGRVRWCQSASALADDELISLSRGIAEDRVPRVEVLMNYAGAGDALVRALFANRTSSMSPLRGIVIAGTGNGTVNDAMRLALVEAAAGGVQVALASRCAKGGVVRAGLLPSGFRTYPGLSAVKTRVRLQMELMA